MRTSPLALFALVFLLLVSAPASGAPRFRVGYETGPAYVAQNDGRYGETGTDYDAGDVGQQKTLARVERAFIELGSGRHQLIFTHIPFELRSRVALERELRFRNAVFPAGTVVDHRYLFDGTRMSYLYGFFGAGSPWELQAGASFQIRSADVSFSAADGSLYTAQDDIGPVGALKVRLTYAPSPDCAWARIDADGISTFGLIGDTKGALYDAALVLGLPIHERFDLTFSTRIYGGGANVPEQRFENWGTFLSATAGILFTLP